MNHHYKFLDMVKDVNDDFATFESWFGFKEPSFLQKELKVYDPEHYDLTPKKFHLERRLKEKEQQLANIEGIRKHYDNQIENIKKEIEELKDLINKKGLTP